MDNTELTWKIAALTERLDKADLFLNTLNDSINKLRESKIEIDDIRIVNYLYEHMEKMDCRIKNQEEFFKYEKKEIKEYYDKLSNAMDQISKIDITQYVNENKFIGKKLSEIADSLYKMQSEGIKKNISLEISCEGYQLVKKSNKSDELDEEILEKDHIKTKEENIQELLESCLSPRETIAIMNRFPEGITKQKTYDQIASILFITRERARQIIMKSLRKLRHPKNQHISHKMKNEKLHKEVFGK